MQCFSAPGIVILGPLANDMGAPNGDKVPKGVDMRAPGRAIWGSLGNIGAQKRMVWSRGGYWAEEGSFGRVGGLGWR